MADWYTATGSEATERLLGAWADAPVENEELCGFLLAVARDQVEEYAPPQTTLPFKPVTLTWPTGATITLSRVGDVVTADAVPGDAAVLPGMLQPIPAEFVLMGALQVLAAGGNYVIEASEYNGVRFIEGDAGPYAPSSARWLGKPAAGTGVPVNLVYAQLQQAKNLWNAGRVSGGGDVGVEQYTYTPRPLDKTIKGIIRPAHGGPRVR